MDGNRYIIILLADGGVEMRKLEAPDEPTLEQLQTLVGGHIEAIAAMLGVLIGNEEAKIYELPYNVHATALMKNYGADCICGDAVLCKPKGDTLTGFLHSHAEWIVNSLVEEPIERVPFPTE